MADAVRDLGPELEQIPAVRRGLGVAIVGVICVSLVAIASYPTGTQDPADVVPQGARLAGDVEVDGAHVLLVSEAGRLRIQVAYEGRKGWLGALLDPAPGGAAAAWTATPGDGPVPALSAVYGRIQGATLVTVTWADGASDETPVAADGVYVVARPGRVSSATVVATDATGSTLREIDGP